MANIQPSKDSSLGKPEKTLGQIAYEGYCKQTNNKSVVSGDTLPEWNSLKLTIQYAWKSAAKAVIDEMTKIKERGRYYERKRL